EARTDLYRLLSRVKKHSYLYPEPYEPIVYGTYSIDRFEPWNMLIIRNVPNMNVFFAVMMAGSHGFRHPGYD
ncbi:255_t:CDS:1, partial [Cetraspora pellucida]